MDTLTISNNNELKNKKFINIYNMFIEAGWNLVENEIDYNSYCLIGDETSSFDIKIKTNKIDVSVPLKNSIYKFVTSFNNIYDADIYINNQFINYRL